MTRNTAFVLAALTGGIFFTTSANAGVVADEVDTTMVSQDGTFCGDTITTGEFVTGSATQLEAGAPTLQQTALAIKAEWEACQAAGIRSIVVLDGMADGQRYNSHDMAQDVALADRRVESLRRELGNLGVPTLASGQFSGHSGTGNRVVHAANLVLGTSLNYDAAAAGRMGVDLTDIARDAEMIDFAEYVSDARQASCSGGVIEIDTSYDLASGQHVTSFVDTRNPNTMGPALYSEGLDATAVRFAHRDDVADGVTVREYEGTQSMDTYDGLTVIYECPNFTEGEGQMVWKGDMVDGVPTCVAANNSTELFQVATGGTVNESVDEFYGDMRYNRMATEARHGKVILTDMCDTDADIEADRRDDRQSSRDDRATGVYPLAGAGGTLSRVSGTHETCDVSANMAGADVIGGVGVGTGNGVAVEAFVKVSPTGMTGTWDEAHRGFVGLGGGADVVTGLNGPAGAHIGVEAERMIVPEGAVGALVEAPIGVELHMSNWTREVSDGPMISTGLYFMPGFVTSQVAGEGQLDVSLGAAARVNVRF